VPAGTRLFLRSALHAAPEGAAIGAAMAVDLPFGMFLALAIAVHNVPEGAAIAAGLTGEGSSAARAAGTAAAAKVNQVLLAVGTWALVGGAPALLSWALGAAAGAFLYLIMSDLLPESYRQAGRTSIALVVAVAMAMLVLLARRVPLP
jgi:zinc transporter ZupT